MSVLTTFNEIIIGGYGEHYAAPYAENNTGIIDTFASVFSSIFSLISDNPALLLILVVAVGVPVVGAIFSLFRGR